MIEPRMKNHRKRLREWYKQLLCRGDHYSRRQPERQRNYQCFLYYCGRSLSIHIVAARQLKDGMYHRRSDILFLPILLRNMSQMRVKNDKKSKYNSAFSHFVAIYQSRQNKEFPILSHIHDNYLIIKLLQLARKHINTAPFNLFKRKQPLKQAKK